VKPDNKGDERDALTAITERLRFGLSLDGEALERAEVDIRSQAPEPRRGSRGEHMNLHRLDFTLTQVNLNNYYGH
jgi:hypothetical protein